MNKIKMVKLDFLTLKPQMRTYLLFLAAILITFGFMFEDYWLLGFACAWTVSFVGMAIFQVQEKDSLERFYGSLSLKQESLVLGRYATLFIFFEISLLASLVAYYLFTTYHGVSPSIENISFGMGVSVLIFSLIIGIQLPIFFRMGYTAGRIGAFIPAFLIMFFITAPFLQSYYSDFVLFIASNQVIFSLFCLLASVLTLIASINVSLTICRKK